MENGLIINEEEFMKLKKAEQMCCLFQNQLKTFRKIDELEKIIRGYKIHQKIQYGLIMALIAVGIFLIKLHLGGI